MAHTGDDAAGRVAGDMLFLEARQRSGYGEHGCSVDLAGLQIRQRFIGIFKLVRGRDSADVGFARDGRRTLGRPLARLAIDTT